jgi:predicted ATPase
MIRRIQALNFRCLRYVDLGLDRFHVLIGPNASGKSTLFDAIAFLGDLVRDGLEAAVGKRTANFQDLVWDRPGGRIGFELAIEVDVPEGLRERLPPEKDFRVFRYEIAIRDDGEGFRISSERALLMPASRNPSLPPQRSLFPDPPSPPATILLGRGRAGMRSVVSKSDQGTDSYYVETAPKAGKGWVTTIAFGPRRSTLANLPESPERFPVATFLKRMLEAGVRRVFLDSEAMRRPSLPEYGTNGFADDGSNLPWVVKRLRERYATEYGEWLGHVQTVLTDLVDIRVVVRPEDRHAYLILQYDTGVEVPSWTASDGTMRLLALTLLAYLPDNREIYLLEEPENGIHPLALEGIHDSLWSAYDAQVLTTTHSPALLGLVEPSEVLCFDKDTDGATDIIPGNEHPILERWQGSLDKNVLFAKGIIG